MRWLRHSLWLIAFGCLAHLLGAAPSDELEQRVVVGSRIFVALMGGEEHLLAQAREQAALRIVVVGEAGSRLVDETLAQFAGKEAATNLPLAVEVWSFEHLLETESLPAEGLFIAQRFSDADLRRLLERTSTWRGFLFSPFEGDVERGVMAGFVVEARVLPFLNLPALRARGLELRPLYLKVSRIHR